MITFLQRFRQMVKELENHPKVSLLNYSDFAPTTLSTFKTIEATLGHTLNPSIKDFYSQTNGLQL